MTHIHMEFNGKKLSAYYKEEQVSAIISKTASSLSKGADISFGNDDSKVNRSRASIFQWDDDQLRRTKVVEKRLEKAAISIQRVFRIGLCAAKLKHVAIMSCVRRKAIVKIQAIIRGSLARIDYQCILLQIKLDTIELSKQLGLQGIEEQKKKTIQKEKETLAAAENEDDDYSKKNEMIQDSMDCLTALKNDYEELNARICSYQEGSVQLSKSISQLSSLRPQIDNQLMKAQNLVIDQQKKHAKLNRMLQEQKDEVEQKKKDLEEMKDRWLKQKTAQNVLKGYIHAVDRFVQQRCSKTHREMLSQFNDALHKKIPRKNECLENSVYVARVGYNNNGYPVRTG